MKKIFIIGILFFTFTCPVKANPIFDINHISNEEVTLPIKGTNLSINMYHYSLSTINTDAFCLDPNLSSATSYGKFEPGLEETHTKNLYNYYLTTNDKEFPRNLIRMGQNYVDNNYNYVDMSTALRMYWFTVGMNTSKDKHYYGYNEELYNIFKDYHGYDLLGDSKTIYEYNPYKSTDSGDGFSYENGFWEAKYIEIDKDKGYPGLTKQNNNSYTFDAMYKTNIRSGGFNCDNVSYDSEKFVCEVLEKDDELISNKSVNYLHLKTKDNITLDNNYLQNLQFKIKYSDKREANNFWITYVQGTSGNYDSSSSGKANQRMYVIEKVNGELIIPIGNQSPEPEEPKKESENKYCNIIYNSNRCTENGNESYSISDDFDCIFNKNNINKIVSDNSNDSSKHTYTTTEQANEYCQIACAEKISFTFPKRFNNIVAGTYYTLKNNVITSTGTRECRATIDMSKFNSKVIDNSDKTYDQINTDILKYTNSKTNYKDNSAYSYVSQNEALTNLYNDIKSKYTGEKTNTCCDSDENGCNKYNYEISVTFNNMDYTAKTCGKKTVGIDEIYYQNKYSLKDLKNDIGLAINKTSINIENEMNKLTTCTENFNKDKTDAIENNYDFNPNITFNYKEPYNTFFDSKVFNHDSAIVETNTNRSFAKLNTVKYNYYSNGKINSKEKNDLYGLNTNDIGSISATVTKKYEAYVSPLKNNIYALIPSGTVVIKDLNGNYQYSNGTMAKSSLTKQLIESETDIYPISLATKEGKYEYSYTVSKLGDFNITSSSNNDLGRFDKFVKEKNRKYYCDYTVIKDITICNDKDSKECDNKPNFYYRNISLNNVNPNKRELGKNWTNEKAKATLCEIAGGKYNNGDCTSQANTSPESTYEIPEYSFTLTPENMQAIKKYNQEKEKDSNGYANFDMTKIDASTKDQNGNALSEGVWYKSNFIWGTNTCQNCFTNKTNEKETTFSKWSDSAKLSGTGPAWK